MSIPKEPRQLMINLMYLVLTAMLALNVSAEIMDAFDNMDKSIKRNTNLLNKSNSNLTAAIAIPNTIKACIPNTGMKRHIRHSSSHACEPMCIV